MRARARRLATLAVAAAITVMALSPSPAGAVTTYSSLPGSAEEAWVTDGIVHAVAASSDQSRIYVGGSFSFFGPATGGAVPVDTVKGDPVGAWPQVSGGPVETVIPDGTGGWYVGGSFTHVDGEPTPNLIRIRSDGTVAPTFRTSLTDGFVYSLALSGGKLFVGGSFGFAGGTARNGFAVLDAATGALLPGWAAPTDSLADVRSVALAPTGTPKVVLIGGRFSGVDGYPDRQHLAAIDLSTGAATAWNPAPDGAVFDVVPTGTHAFVAGSFAAIGGQPRDGLAKLALADAAADATFDVTVNGSVRALKVGGTSGEFLYVGGDFASIGGTSTQRLARMSTTDAVVDPDWAPVLPSFVAVRDLLVRSGDVLVATSIVSPPHPTTSPTRTVVSFSTTIGAGVGAFDVDVEGPVNTLAADGTRVYVGGRFTSADGVLRRNLAAIERTTGRLADWRPSAHGPVLDLDVLHDTTVAQDVVYVGGNLGTVEVGGTASPRLRLAAIDSTGILRTWDPSVHFTRVNAIATDPSTGRIYVGGEYLGGAKLMPFLPDATSATSLPFTGGPVLALDVDAGRVAVGGSFTSTGQSLAVFDAVGVQEFGSSPNGDVTAVDLHGTELYAGGSFSWPRPWLARYVNVSGGGTGGFDGSWVPQATQTPRAVAATASHVFLGTGDGPRAVDVFGGGVVWVPEPTMWRPRDILALPGLVAFGGQGIASGASNPVAGLALFEAGSDTVAPFAKLAALTDAPGPGDATYVSGAQAWFRGDGTAKPSVGVLVRAHDAWESTRGSYAHVSGLRSVDWPTPSTSVGTWHGPGIVAGAPRGLRTQCWKATDPDTNTYHLGWAIDRAIDYWDGTTTSTTKRPDQLPSLPAQLAYGMYPSYDEADSYKDLSCEWNGWIVAPTVAGGWKLQARGDNGIRATVDGYDDSYLDSTVKIDDDVWRTFNAFDDGTLAPQTSAVPWAASQARPMRFQWWENSGGAYVQLAWDQAGAGTFAAIPPGAYVSRAFYRRTYALDTAGGLPAAGSVSSMPVTVKDRAGHVSQASFELINDVDRPAPAANVASSQPGPWVKPGLQLTADAATADLGSGVHAMQLQRIASAPDASGACVEPPAGTAWTVVASVAGGVPLSWTEPDDTTDCRRYRVVVVDNVGNRSDPAYPNGAAAPQWFRVDTAAPDVSSVVFAEPSGWTKATSLPASNDGGAPTDSQSSVRWWFEQRVEARSGTTCGTVVSDWTQVGATSPTTAVDIPLSNDTCSRVRLVVADEADWRVVLGGTLASFVDHTLPTAAIANDPTVPLSGLATLTGSAGDVNGEVVRYRFTYGSTAVTICDDPLAASPFSCTWGTTTLTDGTYAVTLVATDAAGNESLLPPVSFVVDNGAPTFSSTGTVSTGAAGQYVDSSSPPNVYVDPALNGSFTWDPAISDGSGSGIASVTWGPVPVPSGYSMTTATNPHTATIAWTPGSVPTGTSSTFTVTVRDDAGHESTTSLTVITDSDPAVSASISYAGGLGTVPSITVDPGNDGAGSGLRRAELIREDGVRSGTTCSSWQPLAAPLETWDLTVTPSVIPTPYEDTSVARDRCYRYSLRVTDNVGNARTWGPGAEFYTDGPGIEVTPAVAGATTVTEGAASGIVLKVRLRVQPSHDVDVAIAGDGQVKPSIGAIRFTTTDWNVARDVTVFAVDDRLDEPAMSAAVRIAVTASLDPGYANLAATSASVQISDDDVPGLQLELPVSGLAVAEPGSSVTWGLRLTSEPHGTITVSIPSPGPQLKVTTATTLTFTASNWQQPQPVTARAVDDPDVEGPHGASVTFTASASNGADGGYASLEPTVAAVSIADDDSAGFVVIAPTDTSLDEAATSSTREVGVRLSARPASTVTIDVAAAAGQLAAAPTQLSFTRDSWSSPQPVTVSVVDDTVAESSPHPAQLRLRAGGDAAFGQLEPQSVDFAVRDDDPARLETSPGTRWTTDEEGRVLLEEEVLLGSIVRVRAVGDPRADVRVAVTGLAEGQLEVSPTSAIIPAGSTGQVVTFTVKAVADGIDEADVHAASLRWKVSSTDPLYADAVIPTTYARITDTPDRTIRTTDETTSTTTTTTTTTSTTTTDGSGSGTAAEPAADGGTQSSDDGAIAAPPAEGTEGTTVADDGPADDDQTGGGHRSGSEADDHAAEEDERGGAVRRQARRMKRWASENKGKAAVAASASGSAAIWAAAKPLAMAGKALSTAGGGLNTPPGMGQLRHLAKLRGRRLAKKKLRRFWRGKRRTLDRDDLPDEDDWDDFLWGDSAA